MNELNVRNAIPVKVLKDELESNRFAFQTDMKSLYDLERMKVIENILNWFESPDYTERLERSGFRGEPIEENSRLLKLPCDVGDKVYMIFGTIDGVEIVEGTLEVITISKNSVKYSMLHLEQYSEDVCINFIDEDIGQTVFFTYGEAEQAFLKYQKNKL